MSWRALFTSKNSGHEEEPTTASPEMKSGTLYFRMKGWLAYHHRHAALHEDGTLAIGKAGHKANHVLSVRGGMAMTAVHEKHDAMGWRLAHCSWHGEEEPEHGAELACESYREAQAWLIALQSAGVTWHDDVRRDFGRSAGGC